MYDQSGSVANAYVLYADSIRGFIISKINCFHTAEDLTQEVFIRLHRAAGLDKVKDLKAYLFRVANNIVIDYYRSKNGKTVPREMRDIEEEPHLPVDEPSAEEITLNRERVSEVVNAVGELSSLCQRIFWLSRAHGFRNHEIAEMQNICLSTVEKNISRATRHCLNYAASA